MLISVIAAGAFALQFATTPFQSPFKLRLQQYDTEYGFQVTMNRKLQELTREVLEDAEKLTPEEQVRTRFFMAHSDDAFCWGGYHSPTGGVLLGIPHYFAYETASDINLKKYTFGRRSPDPEIDKTAFLTNQKLKSEEAKQFIDSMVLSDDAKRFAIAREIERGKTMSYLTDAITAPLLILAGYWFSRTVNKKFMLLKRGAKYRFGQYAVVVSFVVFGRMILQSMSRTRTDTNIDKRACMLGINYAKGGVEYYDKQFKRNMAARKLNNRDGGTVKGKRVLHAYKLHGNVSQIPYISSGKEYTDARKQECEKVIKSF